MPRSHMLHMPTLATGLALFLLVGWVFQPTRAVLYLMAFAVLAVVIEVTYRRMDSR